jgi:hypothetical protein
VSPSDHRDYYPYRAYNSLPGAMVSLAFAQITAEDIKYQHDHYHEDRGRVMVVVTTVFFVLSLIAVTLRFVTKVVRKMKCRPEDYLIVGALVNNHVAEAVTGLLPSRFLPLGFGLRHFSVCATRVYQSKLCKS